MHSLEDGGVATHEVPGLEHVRLATRDGHKEGAHIERLIAFQAHISRHGDSKRRRRVGARFELSVNGGTHRHMIVGYIGYGIPVLVAANVGDKASCGTARTGGSDEGVARLRRRHILPRLNGDNVKMLIPIVYFVADGAVDSSLSIGPAADAIGAQRAVARRDLVITLPGPKRVRAASIKTDSAYGTVTHGSRREGGAQRVGQHEKAW